MVAPIWRIELLGGLRAVHDQTIVSRFRSQKTASLLAYLAYYPRRQHAREVLIEMLWPESDLDAGRNSLSVALSSLRRQLEPPGIRSGSVVIANRTHAYLRAESII